MMAGPSRGFREINVTPLVDVMLVLLVVFMVTAPLLAAGVPVSLPKGEATPTPLDDAPLVVSVTEDERIFIDDRDVTDTIEQQLRDDPRAHEPAGVFLRADRNARYGVVARVVAATQAAGGPSLNLLIEPNVPD